VSYLEETLAALDREGAGEWGERAIVSDGTFELRLRHWTSVEEQGARRGSRYTMWRAFHYAVEHGVERLLYCEDDIVPTKNALRTMLGMSVPDRCAFVDFHDITRLGRLTRPGLYTMPLGRRFQTYSGTQCMLFPRRTVAWLLEHDPSGVAARGLPNCVDAVLGHLLTESPWPRYAAHLPCLVRHVGAVSAAHANLGIEGRLPSHYPGDDFDSLTLVSS
jgi:hypothetical protein